MAIICGGWRLNQSFRGLASIKSTTPKSVYGDLGSTSVCAGSKADAEFHRNRSLIMLFSKQNEQAILKLQFVVSMIGSLVDATVESFIVTILTNIKNHLRKRNIQFIKISLLRLRSYSSRHSRRRFMKFSYHIEKNTQRFPTKFSVCVHLLYRVVLNQLYSSGNLTRK